MEKVYLEIDAKTGKLKSKFIDASKVVKDFGRTSEDAGTRASKGINKATDSAGKLQTSLTGVRNVLASAFVVAGITRVATSVIRTSDAVAEMGARLKVATVSQREYNVAVEETTAIANRSFTSIKDTVDLYARMSLSLRDASVSQREILRITETVNKAFAVSGASTQEASNAIRQLSQAMSAGVLRGDEFRSIVEQGSRVATILTDSLRITRGELKKMADEGKLSAEIVTKALLEQSAIIDQEFSQFPVTVSRSIQLMSNAWVTYVGESDTAAEVTRKTAEVIQFAANNIDTLVEAAILLTKILVSLAGAKVLGAVVSSLRASTAATVAATSATSLYGTTSVATAAKVGVLGKVSKGVFGFLKANPLGIAIFGGIELISFISDLVDSIEKIPTAVDRVDAALSGGITLDGLELAGAEVSNLKTELEGLNLQLEKTKGFKGISDRAVDLHVNVMAAAFAVTALEKEIISTEIAINKATLSKGFAEGLNNINDLVDSAKSKFKEYRDVVVEVFNDQDAALDKWIESQDESIEKLTLVNKAYGKGRAELVRLQGEQKKATTISKKYSAEIDRVTKAKIKQLKINEKLKADEKQLSADYRTVTDALDDYYNALNPLREAEQERQSILDATEASLKGLKISQEQANDAIKAADKILEDANAEITKYSDKLRTADDVLEDLGVTNVQVERDIELLKEALRKANAEMNPEKALQYADALEKIGNGARSAQEVANIGNISSLVGSGIQSIFSGDGGDAFLGSLEGIFDSAVDSFSGAFAEAFASGGGVSGGLSAGISAVPVAGWIAAAATLGDRLYADGWRPNDGEIKIPAIAGLIPHISLLANRLLQSIGISERWAAILSGAAIITALFGRKAPRIERQGFNAEVTSGGVSGELFADLIRKGGLFRSDRRYTETAELTAEIIQQFEDLSDVIKEIIADTARSIGSDYEGFVTGSFNQTYDADGELLSESSTFAGVTRNEDYEAFVARLTAENIIAALAGATAQIETLVDASGVINIGSLGDRDGINLEGPGGQISVITSELDTLADAYRDNAQEFLNFASFAQLAISNIVDGDGLLGTITEVTEIIEDLRQGSETLLEAYVRVRGGVELLQAVYTQMGIETDKTTEGLIRFSAEMVNFAGGIERATALVNRYFEAFYTQGELLDTRLSGAEATNTENLEGLGLSADTNMAEFREAFEAIQDTLTPAEVVTWLEAADALATYNEIIDAQTQVTEAAAAAEQELIDARLSAFDSLQEGLQGVERGIQGLIGSDFQNSLANINRAEAETIRTLNELAVAAGRAGLSEAQLGRIHLRTALQTEVAIAQLKAATVSLINELYGSQLDDRIAELEALQVSGINNVGNAAENTYERQLTLIRRIRDVVLATRIDPTLSTLTRQEQLAEGEAQFADLIALAQGGDTDAQSQLPALYQQLLGIGREVFASGQGYEDLYNSLTGQLNGVEATGSLEAAPQPVSMVPSAELTALYAERDQRNATAEAEHRLELSAQLAQHLNSLAGALNTPILALAESMGVNIGALVTDLGVNLEAISTASVASLSEVSGLLGLSLTEVAETLGLSLSEVASLSGISLAEVASTLGVSLESLTSSLGINLTDISVASVNSLADVANTLGVELTALATNVGVDLGNLADSQSLLNDALETRIGGLPVEFRDGLAPLLQAVEDAADGTERDAALAALEATTGELPLEYRNALAPFFDNIDPVSELQEQINIANRMETAAELQRVLILRGVEASEGIRDRMDGVNTTLGRINQNLGASNEGNGFNSFAVGSAYVPHDQLANIHKGEIIVTESDSNILRKYGIPQQTGTGNSQGVIAAINTLVSLTGQIGTQTNNTLKEIKDISFPDANLESVILPSIERKKECSGSIF